MEQYLKISYLNDFIFCPLSIYYHQLYGFVSESLYYDNPQIEGKKAHESIDSRHYSTHRNILQGIDVYSDKFRICGKIDLFNIEKGQLTERKKHIIEIYDGYVFQLYAQCFCLREMGYNVSEIRFYSYDDNKVFPEKLPEENKEMSSKFYDLLEKINNFDVASFLPINIKKCSNCIYRNFCDRAIGE